MLHRYSWALMKSVALCTLVVHLLACSLASFEYPNLASVQMMRLDYVEWSEPWYGTCCKYLQMELN